MGQRIARIMAGVAAPLRGPWLYGLLVLAGLLVAGVYTTGGHYRWEMGERANAVYFAGFFGVERAGTVPFRWTAPSAVLRAPGLGAFAGTIHLRLNGDPWAGPPRTVMLQVGDSPTTTLRLDPGWHDYALPFTRAALGTGDLRLHLWAPDVQIPPEQRAPQDTRRLGVPVQWITVDREGGLALPPTGILAITLAAAALLYALAAWLGVPPRVGAAAVAGLVLAWAGTLLGWRLPAALAAPGLLLALALAVALALALRPLLGALFRRGGVRVERHEWAWLAALFVLALVFKAGGLLDPMFVTLDHYARLHRLMEFGADPAGFLQNFLDTTHGETYAGQLGLSAVVPYSPLFYIAFDPLNWLVPDPDVRLQAINLTCSALEASNVFFLFYTLKRAWGDGVAGIWAGAVFVAFPLGNLLFSDGGYPGIFATWLLVLLIAALAWGYPQLRRLRVAAALSVLLALALLAHTAQALLLGTTLVIFAAAVAWTNHRQRGAVLRWAGAGLALAFLSFYQFSAAHVVTDLIPQIVSRLQTAGGVGKSPAKLGAPLLSGFGPQIAAHFRTWPVVLAGGWILDRGWGRGLRPPPAAQQGAPSSPKAGMVLWLGASALAVAGFSVLDTWINLLQKHMIYAMPALALLDGLVLAALWRRGRAGRALVLLLWAGLFAAGLVVWVDRVVGYVLPPGSG